jgi:hypothetical protein
MTIDVGDTPTEAKALLVRGLGSVDIVDGVPRRIRAALRLAPMFTRCDHFDIPSTSHWTDAAITVRGPRTKRHIVTRRRLSTRPTLFSSAG